MSRRGIPTARWRSFEDADEALKFLDETDFEGVVVKASGLAAGKGVVVAEDK